MVGLVVCGGVVAGCWGEGFFCGGWGGVFGMHLCPFWYELVVIGGVFGFLSLWGGLFGFRCMTPLPPLRCVGVWVGLGFSRNCLCFFVESDRGGAVFGLLSLWGVCFRFRCVTPPLCFFLVVVSACG